MAINFIPNKYENKKNKLNEPLIEKNAKFKGFCKYFFISPDKDKRCLKFKNLCKENINCIKRKRGTLQNVLRKTTK